MPAAATVTDDEIWGGSRAMRPGGGARSDGAMLAYLDHGISLWLLTAATFCFWLFKKKKDKDSRSKSTVPPDDQQHSEGGEIQVSAANKAQAQAENGQRGAIDEQVDPGSVRDAVASRYAADAAAAFGAEGANNFVSFGREGLHPIEEGSSGSFTSMASRSPRTKSSRKGSVLGSPREGDVRIISVGLVHDGDSQGLRSSLQEQVVSILGVQASHVGIGSVDKQGSQVQAHVVLIGEKSEVDGWATSLADACRRGGHKPPLGACGLDKVERVHEHDAMLQPSTAECITELRTIVGMKFLAAASKADSLQWPLTPRGPHTPREPHTSTSHHAPPSPTIKEEVDDAEDGALPSASIKSAPSARPATIPEAPPTYSSISDKPPPLPTPPPTKQPVAIPTPLPVKESPRVVLDGEGGGKPPMLPPRRTMLPPRSATKKGKPLAGDDQSRPSQPPGITSISPAQSARRGATPAMGNSPPREALSTVNAATTRYEEATLESQMVIAAVRGPYTPRSKWLRETLNPSVSAVSSPVGEAGLKNRSLGIGRMEYARPSSDKYFGEGKEDRVPAYTLVSGKSASAEQGDGGHSETGSVGANTGSGGGGGGGGSSSSRRLTPRSEMRQAMKGSSTARGSEAHSPPPLSSSRRKAASPGDLVAEAVDEGDRAGTSANNVSGKGVAHGNRIHGTPVSTDKAARAALSPGRDQQNLPGFDFVGSAPETPGSHRGVWMASANRSELFEEEEEEGGRNGKKKMDLHGVSALKGQAGWRKQLELSAAKATVVRVPKMQMADGRASPTLTDWMQQGMSSSEEEIIIRDNPKWIKADVSPPKSGGEEEGDKSLQFGPLQLPVWDFAQGSDPQAVAQVPTPKRKPNAKGFQLGFA